MVWRVPEREVVSNWVVPEPVNEHEEDWWDEEDTSDDEDDSVMYDDYEQVYPGAVYYDTWRNAIECLGSERPRYIVIDNMLFKLREEI